MTFLSGLTKIKSLFVAITDKCTTLSIGLIGNDVIGCTIKGSLIRWTDHTFKNEVKNAHKGPIYSCCDILRKKQLITGGADGFVRFWDESLSKVREIDSSKAHSELGKIRALSYHPSMDKILLGTRGGEIFEIDSSTNITCCLRGHFDHELWGLGIHPKKAQFVTVGEDFLLAKWDIKTKKQ